MAGGPGIGFPVDYRQRTNSVVFAHRLESVFHAIQTQIINDRQTVEKAQLGVLWKYFHSPMQIFTFFISIQMQ